MTKQQILTALDEIGFFKKRADNLLDRLPTNTPDTADITDFPLECKSLKRASADLSQALVQLRSNDA